MTQIEWNDIQSEYDAMNAMLWGVYLNAAHPDYTKAFPNNGITAKDVATMTALLKVARIATGSSPDSFVDLAGYAACAGEIATRDEC